MAKEAVFTFYVKQAGEYYKILILSDDLKEVRKYLENLYKEVRYAGKKKNMPKRCEHKDIGCGIIVWFTFYGYDPPRGLPPDRRFKKICTT